MAEMIRPGTKLFSAVDDVEFIVVKAPRRDVTVEVGGHAPRRSKTDPTIDGGPTAGADGGAAMGKRYVDEAGEIEVLCTRAGAAVISVDGAVLMEKETKTLPSSD